MSFISEGSYLIRKSDKKLVNIYFDNKIYFDFYDENNELTSSTALNNTIDLNSTNINFSLSKNDNIYGVYKNKGLKMITIPSDSNKIVEKDILSYNYKKFNIIFPYLNVINNAYHILYYVYSNGSRNSCALLHHFYNNGVWTENKIDFISHIVLDNFSVLWIQDSPIVFYLNLVDGYEEVFFSRFNTSSFTWSAPCQITDSKKNKLYLSIIKDTMNFYHITFCENVDTGYCVKYLNGYLNENSFTCENTSYLTGPSTCTYPTIIKDYNLVNLMWVNYNKLYTATTKDLGSTWSDHIIDEYSIDDDFIRSTFLSNYENDISYNLTHVYNTYKTVDILGF